MIKYIIFYSTSKFYDSVIVSAKSFNDAFEIAKSFSRAHSVNIIGIFSQSSYIKLYSHE